MTEASVRKFERLFRLSQRYEAYLAERCRAAGQTVTLHQTRFAQKAFGDLRVDGRDMEIKFDQSFHLTENLFVETAEKYRAHEIEWRPSGIYARSSAFWYVIGDYRLMFLFQREALRRLEPRRSICTIGRGTSQGFLLPTDEGVWIASAVKLWPDRMWDGAVVVEQSPDWSDILAAFRG